MAEPNNAHTHRDRRYSSRVPKADRNFSEDLNLDSLSFDIETFLAKRESKRRSTLNTITTVSFHLFNYKDARRITLGGYDLKFEFAKENDDAHDHNVMRQTIRRRLLNFKPPDHISLSAVEYSLARKSYVSNSASWQGEKLLVANSLYQRGDSQTYRNTIINAKVGRPETVSFHGALQLKGSLIKTRVCRPQVESGPRQSVFVNDPSTATPSNTSILAPWPWLDHSKKASELYKIAEGASPNCFEDQVNCLPKLNCPLQARMLYGYLHSVKPCVSESSYKRTHKLVEQFALDHGQKYHDIISNSYAQPNSSMERIIPNYNYRYTWEETPLTNMAIIAPFCHDIWPEKANSALERSCEIIKLMTEFWHLLITEQLKTITDEKGNCLDMGQFHNLFSSVQIPGVPVSNPVSCVGKKDDENSPRHIIIINRGHIFSMDIADENFEPLSHEDIENSLMEIMIYAGKNTIDAVGIVTSAEVDTRMRYRELLIEASEENESILLQIERAIFVLSIDHKSAQSLDKLAHEAIFADGCNRWYAKGLNVYIHNNGLVTVNANKILFDGPIVAYLLHYIHLRLVEEMEEWNDDVPVMSVDKYRKSIGYNLSNAQEIEMELKELQKSIDEKGAQVMQHSLEASNVRALSFTVNEDIDSAIDESMNTFNLISSAAIMATCKVDTLDDQVFSKHKINKDAFAHMVIHLTFYKMYFRVASVGSVISLKKFHGTRNDVMRSTTCEMAEWCQAMLRPTHSGDTDTKSEDRHRAILFWKAEMLHRKLRQQCYNGEGCDNYINALSNLADELDLPPGNMFDDDAFRQAGWVEKYDVNSESLGVGCTSCPVVLPVVPAGYGVGYSVAESFVFFCVSSWDGQVSTNADLYAASLRFTVLDLVEFINRLPSKQELGVK